MHGNGGYAGGLKALCELGRGALARAKRSAHLHGDGHARSPHARANNFFGELRRLHKRRPLALGDDLARRAGHIDVDERELVPHPLLDGFDRRGKLLGLAAKELHADLGLLVLRQHKAPGLVARIREAGNAHHLRVRKARAAAAAHDAVRRIGDARHGCEQEGLLGKQVAHNLRPVLGSHYSSTLRIAMNASCGTSTEPIAFMRFLPSFCFSSSLRLREMSPP